jgi:hypothetical protein
MTEIITKAGATLEATYHALTGQSGGYAAFTEFLAPFFTIGQTAALKTDNPFPILTGEQRTVQLDLEQQSSGAASVASQGTVHVSPFPLCPAKDYHHKILNTPKLLRCTADVSGFCPTGVRVDRQWRRRRQWNGPPHRDGLHRYSGRPQQAEFNQRGDHYQLQ